MKYVLYDKILENQREQTLEKYKNKEQSICYVISTNFVKIWIEKKKKNRQRNGETIQLPRKETE